MLKQWGSYADGHAQRLTFVMLCFKDSGHRCGIFFCQTPSLTVLNLHATLISIPSTAEIVGYRSVRLTLSACFRTFSVRRHTLTYSNYKPFNIWLNRFLIF